LSLVTRASRDCATNGSVSLSVVALSSCLALPADCVEEPDLSVIKVHTASRAILGATRTCRRRRSKNSHENAAESHHRK
jgi:hypothetical protein